MLFTFYDFASRLIHNKIWHVFNHKVFLKIMKKLSSTLLGPHPETSQRLKAAFLQVLQKVVGEHTIFFFLAWKGSFAFFMGFSFMCVTAWLNSRASNTRWLTIHTVCMDLLDSPTTCDMKGPNMHGSIRDRRCMGKIIIPSHYEICNGLNSLSIYCLMISMCSMPKHVQHP